MSFKKVADRAVERVVIQDVPSSTYEAVVEKATNNGDWQAVRVDYNEGVLIVHCPNLGHEILPELFDVMSTITQGGSTTITLAAGSKSPDFSLYEVKDCGVQSRQGTNGLPTIAFEVGYYGEGEKKLALDAGRLICLSKGMIQLVATINVDHELEKENYGRRKLKSVVWTHWEMDPEYPRIVEKNDTYELNKLVAESDGKDIKGMEAVQPTPDAYRAVVNFAKTPHWVRAYKSNTYKDPELFPDQGIKSIPILYRHLFRDPEEADQKQPAFTIKAMDIMATIHSHDHVQREIDGKSKRTEEDEDLVDKELLA
ncbi:hypothetical protein BDR04DRAFT_1123888, partial [Suillus decipiens]